MKSLVLKASSCLCILAINDRGPVYLSSSSLSSGAALISGGERQGTHYNHVINQSPSSARKCLTKCTTSFQSITHLHHLDPVIVVLIVEFHVCVDGCLEALICLLSINQSKVKSYSGYSNIDHEIPSGLEWKSEWGILVRIWRGCLKSVGLYTAETWTVPNLQHGCCHNKDTELQCKNWGVKLTTWVFSHVDTNKRIKVYTIKGVKITPVSAKNNYLGVILTQYDVNWILSSVSIRDNTQGFILNSPVFALWCQNQHQKGVTFIHSLHCNLYCIVL